MIAGKFPSDQVKKSLGDSSIEWQMNLQSDKFLERVDAVSSVEYQQHPSQLRIRTDEDTVVIESVDSLSLQNVALDMTNNIKHGDLSFVLASKYASNVSGYLKLGSDTLSNTLIGLSDVGAAIIVFGTSNMEGRFGFARIHDVDNMESTDGKHN